MAILKVARMGHPVLREVAEPVPLEGIGSPEIQRLIQDMVETCREYDGAGLAAPQVHVSKRLMLMELAGNPRYPGAGNLPLTVVINPNVEVTDERLMHVWEGCLSLPGLRGRVPRHRGVRLSGYDHEGQAFTRDFEGFPAAVVQHEGDHLDGVLYPDRMESLEELYFLEEFDRYRRADLDGPIDE